MTEDKEEKNCYTSRYKALFTNAEDMILFFDADGFVCEKNDAVCKNLDVPWMIKFICRIFLEHACL